MVGFIIPIVILLVSCKEPTDEELFYEVQKTFNRMDSYSTMADIIIYGNKSKKNYKIKHLFKKPNRYVLEIIEPMESKGCITIYDGNQTWLYHPNINQAVLIKNTNSPIEEKMFIGYFLEILFTSEEISISSEILDSSNYLTIAARIPGNNRYRYREKLWINKKDFSPYKLVIYDKENKVTVEVYYTNFTYNANVKDEDFTIETMKQLLNKVSPYVKGEREREVIEEYKTSMG
jgi:outer membrane lipoprotein-sorting protein